MEQLIRLETGLFVKRDGTWNRLGAGTSLDSLLAQPLDEVRRVLEREANAVDAPAEPKALAPIESQEVWAAGVTYKRSLAARAEEAVIPDPYERVYTAARPELFFKATASRVRGPGDVINIRSDSTWDVPEPELAVVCNSRMEVVGYTIGNDMSSRSIEGENTLYLPQAKVFDGCCALGPAVVLAWDYVPDDRLIRCLTTASSDCRSTAPDRSSTRARPRRRRCGGTCPSFSSISVATRASRTDAYCSPAPVSCRRRT